MKKFIVLKSGSKSVVSSNKMSILKKGSTVRLRSSKWTKALIAQGYIREVQEDKKVVEEPKEQQNIYYKKSKKHKSKSNRDDINLDELDKEME